MLKSRRMKPCACMTEQHRKHLAFHRFICLRFSDEKYYYPLTMAFKALGEYTEKPFKRLSDIPLLKERCQESGFCKSGLFIVEHIVPPGRFANFSLVNYTINVRVNVTENNAQLYEVLKDYFKNVKKDPSNNPLLMCQITNRDSGFAAVGVDDNKNAEWMQASLGYTLKV